MLLPKQYKRIVLHERPVAEIEPTTFRTEVLPFDLKPGNGEVLVQVTWLSLDPAMRGYIRDARSYMPPVKIGAVRIYLKAVLKMMRKRVLDNACAGSRCCCCGRARKQVRCWGYSQWSIWYVQLHFLQRKLICIPGMTEYAVMNDAHVEELM